MEDVQSGPAQVPVNIDKVGVRNLCVPVRVRDRADGQQDTVASVDMGVELPSAFKGTHMSRFVAILEQWDDAINYASITRLLEDLRKKLEARKAYVSFCFPYFIRKSAPSSGIVSTVSYNCRITGEQADDGKTHFLLNIDVPVMTVCPCSKAISREGAHSQRTIIHMALRITGFSWLEEFIDIAEQAGSSPVYTLLKREDEKYVTEDAFAHPTFVEDVVRNVAICLEKHAHISWFKVEVESQESIHSHNAFACIERTLQ